jgi:hypothetical protein
MMTSLASALVTAPALAPHPMIAAIGPIIFSMLRPFFHFFGF